MLFNVPYFFAIFGSEFVYFAKMCIHEIFASLWITRIYFYTVTFSSLLAGLRAELLIVANNYRRIVIQIQAELQESSGNKLISRKDDAFFWTNLYRQIGSAVNQHVELLRNVAIIKPALEMAFLVMYIRMILCIGLLSFIVVNSGLSSTSALLLPVVVGYLVECYWAGILADSFQDVNQRIINDMSELCVSLPYSNGHHADYIQMRTSLMIILLCTSDSIRISCGGFFQMSSRVVLRVVNVLYTVSTFLWQMKTRLE
ncbi:uncharacterized protein LOC129720247 [Wyeomyia smithii]|uniref:uncharacterized protein LOC129720247 n=1 Tax=Wyeomyia smithii TaxID=174621 RepID=UPI00246811FA|nr:uncharacterized protein LOC129720247 [Wyeomyia smithii]